MKCSRNFHSFSPNLRSSSITEQIAFQFFVEILWYHNSKFLKATNNIKIDIDFDLMKSTLIIVQVTSEHVGFYQCKAVNDLSEEFTKAKLELASGVAKSSEINQTEQTVETKSSQEIIAKDEKVKTKAKTKRFATKGKAIVKQKDIEQERAIQVRDERTQVIIQESKEETTNVSSTSSVQVTTHRQHIEEENIEILEETEEIHVKIYKEAYSQEEIENFKVADEVNYILDAIDAKKYGTGETSLRELATIGHLLKKGISVYEVTQLYNADFFPALKLPESQSALVQLVERQGYENLIAEVLNTETEEDENLLASTVGFRAFMRMIELTECMIEEVITNFKFEDFVSQEWKYKEIKDDSTIDVSDTRTMVMRTEKMTSNGK